MTTAIVLGTLHLGAWTYRFTERDLQVAGDLLETEGGASLLESRSILSAALRRFALIATSSGAYTDFASFAIAYGGGEGREGTRRERLLSQPGAANPALQAVAEGVLTGRLSLTAYPAEEWAAASLFPGLDASDDAAFLRTVKSAVRLRGRSKGWEYVRAPGTVLTRNGRSRSNIFVSSSRSRSVLKSDIFIRGPVTLGGCLAFLAALVTLGGAFA